MRDLREEELLFISGGTTAPQVSSNALVQAGYAAGWHVGHAIGQTIKDVGTIASTLGDWIFG